MSFGSGTWEEEMLYVFLLGFTGLTQLKPSDTESNKFMSEQPHCPLHRFLLRVKVLKHCFSFFSRLFFFPYCHCFVLQSFKQN